MPDEFPQNSASAAEPISMFLVSVIPLSRAPLGENLSYFSKQELTPGSLVEIPVRGRELFGLVASCESVRDLKSAIKNAPFPLKKIESLKAGRIFEEAFVAAAQKTADYFAGNTGAILRVHISETILEKWDGVVAEEGATGAAEPRPSEPQSSLFEQYLLQAPNPERESTYRSLIREEFAKKLSILMLVPNKAYATEFAGNLAKGIDEYAIVLHGDLSKKELLANWERALGTAHPVLIIATTAFLAIPRQDIGTYILEHESSAGYRSLARPFFDTRILAEELARARGAKIIFADTLLSFETLAKKELTNALALAPLKHRLVADGETRIVDLTKRKDRRGEFFLSDDLLALTRDTHLSGGRLFLFTTRKGIAPLTVCSDCGTTLACIACKRPLVLHAREPRKGSRDESPSVFICHSCNKEYPSDMRCNNCASWRLAPLGVGVERVHAALAERFPGAALFSIDGDSTKTHKQAALVAESFAATAGAILIGTEMALPYLQNITASAVVLADNLFAIPDFRMSERLMHALVGMRERTAGTMLIQTRKPDLRIFHHAGRGTLFDFYREEMDGRKKFNYPPYSLFIKITREGKADEVQADMDFLEESLALWKPDIFSGFGVPRPGEETMHALVRLEPELWPDAVLLERLRLLPSKFFVQVAPEDLF